MSGSSVLTPVATSLVTGPTAGARERLIAAQLPPATFTAVLLEGLPDGHTILVPSPTLLIERIAPGCLCCTGNLVLRVTLNRLLRRRPARLFIGPATTEHLDQLRSWLQHPPYDQLLELTADLCT
ncbi:MAG: GTPase [Massilia sp.]|nr:GTPase [Massilia sp.]